MQNREQFYVLITLSKTVGPKQKSHDLSDQKSKIFQIKTRTSIRAVVKYLKHGNVPLKVSHTKRKPTKIVPVNMSDSQMN